MRLRTLLCAVLASILAASCTSGRVESGLRASAYPLVTIDPFTSAWSAADNLYDAPVTHWTGQEFPLVGTLCVDGASYRFLGTPVFEFETLLPGGTQEAWPCRYTFNKPSGEWMAPDYNASSWKSGAGSFGYLNPDTSYRTVWNTPEIWVRREFVVDDSVEGKEIYLDFSHDEDAVVYLNGIKVADLESWECNGRILLPQEAAASLKNGVNVIAACCKNADGDAALDLGLSFRTERGAAARTTAIQKSVNVQATQTHYCFECGPVNLGLTFTAPLLLDNLDLVSRPVNYISYDVASADGKAHEVSLEFAATGGWARNFADQPVELETSEDDNLLYLKAGTKEQNVLGRKGDHVCIDWGYFYMAAEKDASEAAVDGSLLRLSRKLGEVRKNVSGKIMIGYDDIYSVQYFGENLRPYWNREGNSSIQEQFVLANAEYDSLMDACGAFDCKLMEEATAAGGRHYAELCAVAYRQAIAAHKLVQAPNGDLLWLSKENDSNGSIGTVDVTYPSAPLFLLYNPELAKGLLNHIFFFSESGRWTKPFSAHDVGTYPLANGQTYGGDMPVEESGNMLILTAAICHYQNDWTYAQKHWDILNIWADYLLQFGLDPENQLCTDDFAGHSAHNTNLSIKAILGIACFGRMASALGYDDIAGKYTALAKEMAQQWVEMADAGDHYSRTFGDPSNWSQKYNLVWDKLLGLDIFPADVARKEMAFYPSVELEYGLPLDERSAYTKTDWVIWTASLAEDKADFERLVDYIYRFECETVDRLAMSDWIWTDKPEHVGFIGRSVVGGYFIRMLPSE